MGKLPKSNVLDQFFFATTENFLLAFGAARRKEIMALRLKVNAQYSSKSQS
jgi:hypothetical protein